MSWNFIDFDFILIYSTNVHKIQIKHQLYNKEEEKKHDINIYRI